MDSKTAFAASGLVNQVQAINAAVAELQEEMDNGTSLARLAVLLDPIIVSLPQQNKNDLLASLLNTLQAYQAALSKQLAAL